MENRAGCRLEVAHGMHELMVSVAKGSCARAILATQLGLMVVVDPGERGVIRVIQVVCQPFRSEALRADTHHHKDDEREQR